MPKSDPSPDTTIYELAERIGDEVRLREPDWASLTEWAEQLARMCAERAESA